MNSVRIAALVLIVAGVMGLAYGGFTYTKDTHEATLGPLKLSVTEKETINVPIWAGVGAIVIGGVLLVLGARKG
jgi:TRAP-type C4-dicarboxylate transport system permease small subunit